LLLAVVQQRQWYCQPAHQVLPLLLLLHTAAAAVAATQV
jgi:hypothetical protein